jgi:dolichol kinase|tara:strand:+ start:527 stop:739 length:213 start_codon:yes stop_codon:yes gene_type:complete
MIDVPNKDMWQKNRRYMAWSALAIMAIVTLVILLFPDRIKPAESIIMMMYGSLSALVGAYFGFANIGKKK